MIAAALPHQLGGLEQFAHHCVFVDLMRTVGPFGRDGRA
jgi:hypothetical protein